MLMIEAERREDRAARVPGGMSEGGGTGAPMGGIVKAIP